MKNGKVWAIVLVGLLAALLIFIGVSRPQAFIWEPTHLAKSGQPFGAKVFDEVLSRSLDVNYSVVRGYLSDVASDSTLNDCNVMLVTSSYTLWESEKDAIDTLLGQGRNVLLVVRDITVPPYYEEGSDVSAGDEEYTGDEEYAGDEDVVVEDYVTDDYNYDEYNYNYNYRGLGGGYDENIDLEYDDLYALYGMTIVEYGGFFKKQMAHEYSNHDTRRLTWEADNVMGKAQYEVLPSLINSYLNLNDSNWTTVASYDRQGISTRGVPVVAVRQQGDARFIVATTPLVVSNYGILDKQLSPFAMRLVSLLGTERPIVRADVYGLVESGEPIIVDGSQSFLSYLLEHKALRWALYTLLALLVLGMIFTARRRQRVIPPQSPPHNMTLDMVKHYGQLFFGRHNNKDLLFKKYSLFGLDLFHHLMIDIDNPEVRSDALETLSQVTSRDLARLDTELDELYKAACGEDDIGDKEAKKYIDWMNTLLDEVGIRKQTLQKTANNDK